MIEIPLGHGLVSIIDDEDAELAHLRWFRKKVSVAGPHIYAFRNVVVDGRSTTCYLHRMVVGAKAGEIVDHIDRNTLNNRRCNLRIVTASENARNRQDPPPRSNTGILGVTKTKYGTFTAQVSAAGKVVFWKTFRDLDEAVIAVSNARSQFHP